MRFLPLVTLALGCMEYNQSSFFENGVPAGTDDGGPPAWNEIPDGWGLDAWDLPSDDTIDVVVYGDTSSSMSEELQTMGQAVKPFVERLATHVEDWQLAVVTGNTGCAVNGILTPSTPDFEGRFADGIVTPPADTDEDEMGLQNVAIGVERSGPGDCNDGMIRGGLLHLIFVSDENDESPGFDQREDYWRDWFDRIVAVHGDPGAITISAVAGPTPDGCEGADPGFGYDLAVDGTGGEFLSICDDWANQIELLADAPAFRDVFPLTDVPIVASLQVWVNAAEVTSGWGYDAQRNAVIFSADPPAAGDRVDILYDVEGE